MSVTRMNKLILGSHTVHAVNKFKLLQFPARNQCQWLSGTHLDSFSLSFCTSSRMQSPQSMQFLVDSLLIKSSPWSWWWIPFLNHNHKISNRIVPTKVVGCTGNIIEEKRSNRGEPQKTTKTRRRRVRVAAGDEEEREEGEEIFVKHCRWIISQ